MRHTTIVLCAVTAAAFVLHCAEVTDPEDTTASVTRAITDLLDTAQAADYLVVAADGLEEAAKAYVDYRMGNTTDDVANAAYAMYGEVAVTFDSGAFPLQELLRYAAVSWSSAPQYVVLLGDIPSDTTGYTASWDRVYMDPDGDGVAEVAVGRIPAQTNAEAGALLEKIRTWESGVIGNRALFIADDSCQGGIVDHLGIEQVAAAVRDTFDPGHTHSELLAVSTLGTGCAWPESLLVRARDSVCSALCIDRDFVTWVGHANAAVWGDEAVLSFGGTSRLSDGAVYIAAGGQTADYTADSSLATELLFSAGRGAVAYIGYGGEAYVSHIQRVLSELYGLVGDGWGTVGQCWVATANALGPPSLATALLLGDPAMRVSN